MPKFDLIELKVVHYGQQQSLNSTGQRHVRLEPRQMYASFRYMLRAAHLRCKYQRRGCLCSILGCMR